MKINWFWKRKPKVVIEYRKPTEVETVELWRAARITARLKRAKDAKDAKIQAQIREIESSIAPQLQQIAMLRSKLSNNAQFYGLAQMAAQQQSHFHLGQQNIAHLLMPLAGLGAAR